MISEIAYTWINPFWFSNKFTYSLIFLKNTENNIFVGSNGSHDSIHTVVAKINVIILQLTTNVFSFNHTMPFLLPGLFEQYVSNLLSKD